MPWEVDNNITEAFREFANNFKPFKEIWWCLDGVEITRTDLKNGVFL